MKQFYGVTKEERKENIFLIMSIQKMAIFLMIA